MLPWLVEIGLISVATVWPGGFTAVGLPAPKGNFAKVSALPAPSNFAATAIIFGPLALLADNSEAGKLASLTAWGFVLASLLSVIDPTSPIKPCTSTARVSATTSQATTTSFQAS